MVDAANPVYSSVAGALFDKSQSTLILCPGGTVGSYTIPTTVTNIGLYAFAYCPRLTSIIVDAANPVYSSVEGVLFNSNQTILIQYLPGEVGAYKVPSRVTGIGDYAFAFCGGLAGLHFQGDAPSLGTGVFSNATPTVYYLPWTTGWSSTFGGVPTVVWNPLSLVQNGDFETGAFSTWILVGSTNSPRATYNAVMDGSGHSGRYGGVLGDIRLASLSQTLPTVPGQYYLLSLWLDNPSSGTNQLFSVNWNTNTAATNNLFSIVNPPAFPWTNLQFLVIATDTNTTLQIQAENDPNCFSLDDISLTPIPIPAFQTGAGTANSFQLSWLTAPGVAYQVPYKTNLLQTDWSNLTGSIVATNTSFTLLDTNAVGSSPGRFYRFSLRTP